MPVFAILAFRNLYNNQNNQHLKNIWDWKYFIPQVLYWLISWNTYNFAMIYSTEKVYENITIPPIYETHNRAVQLGHGLQFLYVTLMY